MLWAQLAVRYAVVVRDGERRKRLEDDVARQLQRQVSVLLQHVLQAALAHRRLHAEGGGRRADRASVRLLPRQQLCAEVREPHAGGARHAAVRHVAQHCHVAEQVLREAILRAQVHQPPHLHAKQSHVRAPAEDGRAGGGLGRKLLLGGRCGRGGRVYLLAAAAAAAAARGRGRASPGAPADSAAAAPTDAAAAAATAAGDGWARGIISGGKHLHAARGAPLAQAAEPPVAAGMGGLARQVRARELHEANGIQIGHLAPLVAALRDGEIEHVVRHIAPIPRDHCHAAQVSQRAECQDVAVDARGHFAEAAPGRLAGLLLCCQLRVQRVTLAHGRGSTAPAPPPHIAQRGAAVPPTTLGRRLVRETLRRLRRRFHLLHHR